MLFGHVSPVFFGALGAGLAGIGPYGLPAYRVARRRNEIGIRVALGASAGDLMCLVVKDAPATVFAGPLPVVPMAIRGRSLAATMIQDLPVQTTAPLAWVRWRRCDSSKVFCTAGMRASMYNFAGRVC